MDAGFVALGLVQGALAGLNALGIVLLWRTARVINLAQPAIGLVGGVLTGLLVASAGWAFWWAAPVGIGVSALLGFVSERLVMTRLAALPRTVPMVATIGLAAVFQALQSGMPFAFGGRLPSYDVDVGVELFVFPVLLKGPHLLALFSMPVALGALWWFMHRTRVGTAAIAAGQDLERAEALGVHGGFVRALAWTVAGALSGIAGVLSIPVLGFSLGDGVGATVLLLALAPAVLAGLRSVTATAAAALAVGVAYQFVLVRAPTAGLADVLIALFIVVALSLRRRLLQREASAGRASSWAAAVSARPPSRRLQLDRRWQQIRMIAAAGVVAAAAVPPLWMASSGDVRYGTGAALVLAAVAVAAAWMFSGELALGHWGIAALGATAAHAAPGPLVTRIAAGVLVGAACGLVLAVVARHRGGLAAAAAGLALATAAPYWLVRSGAPTLGLDPQTVAVVAGAVAALGAVGMSWLRGQPAGVRMVAARDEARRAAGLGVAASRLLSTGMVISGALAGLAGVVYLAAVPAGIAPGAFDATRSLDVLAFAVVGGLGSAVAAATGAAGLLAAGILLPPPWGTVATGAGVLWVVLFAPAGLGNLLASARDFVGRVIRPGLVPAPVRSPVGDDDEGTPDGDDGVLLVAGADTRDALSTPTVRAASTTAFLVGAPSLAGLFGAGMALRDHAGVDVGSAMPWLVLAVGVVAVAAGVFRWRTWRPGATAEPLLIGACATALVAFVVTGDALMVSVLCVVAPALGGWVIAGLARTAASACVPRSRAAAAGVVVAATTGSLVGAAHLSAVAGGNMILEAARWAALYLAVGCATALVAARRVRGDRHRVRHRLAGGARVGRRRWAPLRVDELTVDLGARRVLSGVSLEVGTGEFVALVGANGAGKSTLLRAVAGLAPITAGRLDVAGEEITALRADERAGVGVAFVSGARPVFPDLTVRENLRVGGYLTHRDRRSFSTALEHVLSVVPAIRDRLDVRAGLLSGGEQRQLAVAQTLFRRPALLLADELTLGLDRHAQGMVLALLRALADDGIGVVVVDHDLHALTAVADRVLLLRAGAVTAFDDPDVFRRAKDNLLPARFLVGAIE